MSDFGWRLSSDFRLSDYDQRLSRSEVSDFGWRLSDYDRPPSFRVEVRRFSDLLTGWWPISHRGGRTFYTPFSYMVNRNLCAGGGRCRWSLPVVAMFAKNLDFLLRLRLTGKCKYAILYLPKGSKCKSIQRQAAGRKGKRI